LISFHFVLFCFIPCYESLEVKVLKACDSDLKLQSAKLQSGLLSLSIKSAQLTSEVLAQCTIKYWGTIEYYIITRCFNYEVLGSVKIFCLKLEVMLLCKVATFDDT